MCGAFQCIFRRNWFPQLFNSLLLGGLFSGLGDLSGGSVLEVDGFDDTDGDGLTHVTYGEATQWGEVRERLDAHGLGWNQGDHSSITRLDEFGVFFGGFAGTTIAFLLDFSELAGNVGGVAIEHGGVTVSDLAGVVQHDDLSVEVSGSTGWVGFGVTSNESTTEFLDGDVLYVETNVVTGESFSQSFVVHFYGLDFSGQASRGEGNDHTGLDDAGFDTANGDCSDTANFVDVLEGKTEGLVGRAGGGQDVVKSLKKGSAGTFAFFALDGPSLEPGHLGGGLQHVVSVPSGDGDEGNGNGVVTDLLDVAGNFLLDFLVAVLAVWGFGGVHFVDTNDELLDTQGVGEKGVLTGLSVLRDTGFEFTDTSGDDKHSAIGLGGTSNHVLDEITMSGGIDDGDVELSGLELPQSNIDGDTTFTLGLEFVQNPGVLEGAFAHFLGFLLELFDGTLVDTSAFVDQMTGGGGFARVDVANNDDVNMCLFLAHGGLLLLGRI